MSGYTYVPDLPLEGMRGHAAKEVAEWKRSLARAEKSLEASTHLLDHWQAELASIEAEQKKREATQ